MGGRASHSLYRAPVRAFTGVAEARVSKRKGDDVQSNEQDSGQKRLVDKVLSRRLANFFLTGFFRI
jgi:hypothetical protein